MIKHLQRMLLLLALLLAQPLACPAGETGQPAAKAAHPAILLVTFGTSVPSAQAAFATIEQQVRKAYPDTEIRWAYTSAMIRKKLAKEGKAPDSPEIALARLMEEGYKQVVVQSLHMIPGHEFHEIHANSKLFGQMAGGFDQVQVAYPLLSGNESMDRMLRIIADRVVPKERTPDEAVVLMGHGTNHPSDAIYSALMLKAQAMDANLFVATVEGHPSFAEVKATLARKGIRKAYLIPLMTVAGDHAKNDMAGDQPDSWKSQLGQAGVESVPVLKGLAEFEPIVEMWIENLRAAMGKLAK